MTPSGDEPDDVPDRRVRSYVLTGGRTRSNADLPLETLVQVTAQGTAASPRLAHERRDIVELCTSPTSVAEVSALLHLPLGVARVLVGDMSEEGFLTRFEPQHAATGERPDLQLLERVLDGLQAL